VAVELGVGDLCHDSVPIRWLSGGPSMLEHPF
jgi:hypothetical protein